MSIHFDTRSTLPRPASHHHECFIDYEYPRDDAVDGAWLEVSEPCDPDDERYEGPWPEDEQADITIHDVRYVYETDEGEHHPASEPGEPAFAYGEKGGRCTGSPNT